jgi:hypothetical protein
VTGDAKKEVTMKTAISWGITFGALAMIATPALAGVAPVPEPEIAAGLLALAGLGVGYRLLKRRTRG